MALPKTKAELAERLLAHRPEASAGARWADDARAAAEARIRAAGGPVRRDEYWKYTDPRRFLEEPPARAEATGPDPFGDVAPLRLVIADGAVDPARSDADLPPGLTVEPLGQALSADIHWARDVFGVLETRGQDPVARPLAALNTARAGQGFVIRAEAPIERPLQIVHAPGEDPLLHHVVRVEAGAKLTLLETGLAGARASTVLEVDVADGGAFHHVRLQGPEPERVVLSHLFARLGRAASAKSFTLAVGGALTRNEAIVEFTGDEAQAHVAGAFLGRGAVHHDDTVFVTHDAVNCESRQVFKKVLRDGALGTFQGKILVKSGAQKTDGYQISQGLLLDDDSQFLAKPELEIYADDVACSHGSTVGTLDGEALFYLTSRGISRAEAQELLVLAFLDEAIQEIEDTTLADVVRGVLSALAR